MTSGGRRFLLGLGSAFALLGIGCQSRLQVFESEPMELEPMPVVASPTVATRVEFPMKLIGGLVVVETEGDDGPWRFLIDTGASRTLVSPEYAIRHLQRPIDPNPPTIWLRDASGRASPVESVMLDRIDFGRANFQNVRALIFDCGEISDHLGLPIHGVLGFSLFSNARLTLDYPGERVIMSALDDTTPMRGCILPFTAHNDVPMVQLALGTRSLLALIDTGSDGFINLDPAGLDVEFASPPREGTLIGTLHGDHRQIVARLAKSLYIGDHEVVQPIADLSGSLTSLGGELLQNFEITFDQEKDQVAFYRAGEDMRVLSPPKWSSGLSFNKARAYWKINAIAPNSPAARAGFKIGDLVSRLNGEPVEQWDLTRYRALVDAGGTITYTLIKGREEVPFAAATFVLVP
ncbi:aspartyl protease family protein [Synoicihabitans lomoniglobus]|uniref:Aspartyl protease family protein n=1 Tax=Synoicihabitans lomoniglobus TaxID=2909285 RepID=A0AAF0CQX3_9BACT|nr:aspartyl protease family protein [Opitutaceae bacterium LMO-M01]WED66408.1 aspartyl protease family protein [Opitutaceae bacterium LMO-M01]